MSSVLWALQGASRGTRLVEAVKTRLSISARPTDEGVHLTLRNPLVPQAIQRSENAASNQSVNGRRRNTESHRGFSDGVGQRFGGDSR
jgi:hypothetical protein